MRPTLGSEAGWLALLVGSGAVQFGAATAALAHQQLERVARAAACTHGPLPALARSSQLYSAAPPAAAPYGSRSSPTQKWMPDCASSLSRPMACAMGGPGSAAQRGSRRLPLGCRQRV